MASSSIKVKLRPLRLAFIVEPGDSDAIASAIHAASFLWGGCHNPIIPYFRRRPNSWSEKLFSAAHTGKSIFDGYLSAFDPDFVVKVGQLESCDIDLGQRLTLKASEILRPVEDESVPSYGIGLFEILRKVADEELRFIRHKPVKFAIPRIPARHKAFLSAVFGQLPATLEKTFDEAFSNLPGLERPSVTIGDYWKYLHRENLFFRRIGMHGITPRHTAQNHLDCLFFLKASQLEDVVDYWNLRAIGWTVIPVCEEVADDPALIKFASEFVEENSWPFRHNKEIFNRTTLLRSRNSSVAAFERFSRSLTLRPRGHVHDQPFVTQDWMPRIWDNRARAQDGVSRCELEVEEKEYSIQKAEDTLHFRSIMPDFAYLDGGILSPRCANDVEIKLWSPGEMLAEVIPQGGEQVARAAGGYDIRDWRCSEKGMVHFVEYADWNTSIQAADAPSVFTAWLAENHWNAKISDKGRIAHQIFKQMGGSGGVGYLAIPGMVEFVGILARKGIMVLDAIRGELAKVVARDPHGHYDKDRMLSALVNHKMVQLGVQVQCPRCRQHPWYSAEEIRYSMKCEKCLELFQLPSDRPKELVWAYRAVGPFSLPNYAHGSVAVLLTLRFFMQQLQGATTPMLSFTAKKQNKDLEIDLGLFFRASKHREIGAELILAECKTNNAFEKKDAARMLEVAAEFPGAIIVFATLKKELSNHEKKILRPVVNRGRRYWKHERPNNPVLILTGNELLADRHPQDVWRDLAGAFGPHGHRSYNENELIVLADSSQQIYLGLESWHVWRGKRAKPRRKVADGPMIKTKTEI
jgi:hypothetical protein